MLLGFQADDGGVDHKNKNNITGSPPQSVLSLRKSMDWMMTRKTHIKYIFTPKKSGWFIKVDEV